VDLLLWIWDFDGTSGSIADLLQEDVCGVRGPGAKGAECGPWKVDVCLLHHLRSMGRKH